MQKQRRRLKAIDSREVRSAQEALRLRRLARALDIKREWLLRRARQYEAASQTSDRLQSSESPVK